MEKGSVYYYKWRAQRSTPFNIKHPSFHPLGYWSGPESCGSVNGDGGFGEARNLFWTPAIDRLNMTLVKELGNNLEKFGSLNGALVV